MHDLRTACRTTLTVLLLAYAGAVVVTNVLPTRRTLAATEQRLTELERENASHRRVLDAAEAEAEALQGDPWAIERILRDEYRMSRAGDVTVR